MFGLLETAILEKTRCREAIFSKVAGGSLATHSLIFLSCHFLSGSFRRKQKRLANCEPP